MRRNQSSDSALTATDVEDTHLTLAFKVEANNSLIFLLLQTSGKKFPAKPITPSSSQAAS